MNPPEFITMWWCDRCGRLQEQTLLTHYWNGRRCNGVIHGIYYDKRIVMFGNDDHDECE